VNISENDWNKIKRMKVCGDWLFYLKVLGAGQMAYVPSAKSFFRQHLKNTSGATNRKPDFYQEHVRVLETICGYWRPSDIAREKFYSKLKEEYNYLRKFEEYGPFERHVNFESIEPDVKKSHILMAFLGFSLGGGEIVPIILANELVNAGYLVSALVLNHNIESTQILNRLNPAVPVYFASDIQDMGLNEFICRARIDLIHTHIVSVDDWIVNKNNLRSNIPYFVTLHGSYEAMEMDYETLEPIRRRVDTWFYLHQKNLKHLTEDEINRKAVKIRNGYPVDTDEFPGGRAGLGIDESAFVMTIASRAIKEKGWREAILATKKLNNEFGLDAHLLLAGEGNVTKDLRLEYGSLEYVHFLGFQENIHGLYRISNYAMLPSRFSGESLPLTLIQAMQVGCPVIATDIGGISELIQREGCEAGILISPSDEDEIFIKSIVDAVLLAVSHGKQEALEINSLKIAEDYDMKIISSEYIRYYANAIKLVNE
jgi:glycosyltransferase involved in cell wall biosynthesis